MKGMIFCSKKNTKIVYCEYSYFGISHMNARCDRAVDKNNHLMTGPKGNSEFGFPETLNGVEGKQNSLFSESPVIKCFVIPPNSK